MEERTRQRLLECLSRAVETGDTAGVSLLVRKDQEDVFYATQGYANLETREPLRRDHIFRLYSMTKPITAVAAMLLVERGELDLEMPVSCVLPGFANQTVWDGGKTVPVQRPVTVRSLLNMTSGLHYGEEDAPQAKAFSAYLNECGRKLHTPQAVTTQEFANALGKFPLAFQPDTSWCYGFSADVLGAVIEVVSGLTLGQFMERNLFAPLKMTDTGFWVPEEKQHRLVRVYEPLGDGRMTPYNGEYLLISSTMDQPPEFASGGAGLTSTIDDYARFAQLLLNRGKLDGQRILAPQTVDFLLGGSLTPEQQRSLEIFGGHSGYTYSHLLRRMVDPGRACLMGQTDEYGWAGWLRCYFANLPRANATVLLMQQRKGPMPVSLARKVRNILAQELVER